MALLHKWSSKSQELRAAGEYINFSVLWSKFWTALWRETCPYLLQKLDILFSSNLSFRCPNDVTVQYHSAPSVSAQRFSLEAFKFIAGHPFVFVHCHVTVCNATDPDSQCVQKCPSSGRGKRAAGGQMTDTYFLAEGPLHLARNKREEKRANNFRTNGM